MKQQTIKQTIEFEGVGLHTGEHCQIKVNPAEANHGIKFKRTDLDTEQVIDAIIANVSETKSRTALSRNEVSIDTVEHLLSAFYGLGIDNVEVEVNGPEIPILDGSSKQFIDGILSAGIEELEVDKDYFEIDSPLHFSDDINGADYTILPAEKLEITTLIDFGSKVLGEQFASLNGTNDFINDIAPARTFVFLKDLEALYDANLIRGGNLENALVIVDKVVDKSKLERIAKKLNKPYIDIDSEGIINEDSQRFTNEPARHKLLDIIGDLSLLGKPLKAKIIAKKPSHASNIELTKFLRSKYLEKRKLRGKPKYDPNLPPIMDTVQIQELLPHRYPFLLVDKIIELNPERVVGVKNVSFNESFFMGHFPGNPVFPGVLQMEALAQTGGILALSAQDDPGNWDTYFLKMENVKFKAMVRPGDTMILKMEFLSPIKRGICHMQGIAYVGDKIVSEGELTAQIVKRPS